VASRERDGRGKFLRPGNIVGILIFFGIPYFLIEFSCDQTHSGIGAAAAFMSALGAALLYWVMERWISRHVRTGPRMPPRRDSDVDQDGQAGPASKDLSKEGH
jgi:Na+/melibiose symporter-like transporter